MPIIDYPDWLPLAQKASKNMTLDTGFQTDQPAVGPAIFQNLTDDLKVTRPRRGFSPWRKTEHFSNGYVVPTIFTAVFIGSECR